MTQNYLQIQDDVVTDLVVWDGGSEWTPPANATMLIQITTPAIVWVLNTTKTDYVLTEVMGVGQIGFIWDGTVVTTNQSKPVVVSIEPLTTGVKQA